MKKLSILLALLVLTGCATTNQYEREEQVEDCTINLLKNSERRAVYLTKAASACAHIYGLEHQRNMEERELFD